MTESGSCPRPTTVIRARKGAGRVGVIAPFTSFASFAQRLKGVIQVAKKEGFEVVLYDEESAAETRLASLPITRHVDGLIVMSLPFSDAVAGRLTEQGVPTVLMELGRQGFSSVTHDNVAGGRMVADLLVGQGHERLAYIGHAQAVNYVSQSQMRLDGFASKLPAAPEVRLVQHSSSAAYEAALELLSLPDRPTGVFAYSDVMAGGVLRAARKMGLEVPDHVGVVGFDDSDLAEALGLSSVRQPLEESGQIAMETLLAQLANPQRRSPPDRARAVAHREGYDSAFTLRRNERRPSPTAARTGSSTGHKDICRGRGSSLTLLMPSSPKLSSRP